MSVRPAHQPDIHSQVIVIVLSALFLVEILVSFMPFNIFCSHKISIVGIIYSSLKRDFLLAICRFVLQSSLSYIRAFLV